MSSPYTTRQIAELSGASVRQIEHWGVRGYVPIAHDGSGHTRAWSEEDLRLVRYLAKFVRAGFSPAISTWLAQQTIAMNPLPGMVTRIALDDVGDLWLEVTDTATEG